MSTNKKKYIKLVLFIVAILIGLAFIPSEQEVGSGSYLEMFDLATSNRLIVYRRDLRCLNEAWESSKKLSGSSYEELATNCEDINTNLSVDIVKFSNGSCDYWKDGVTGITQSDCPRFYIKNGKLFWTLNTEKLSDTNYVEKYSNEIDIRIVSGPSMMVESYRTKTCFIFGLLCSSGELLENWTNRHNRLIIGDKASIKRYNNVCDGLFDEYILNDESCIGKNNTYKTITISDLLRL